jgi:hypothetical protein
MANNYVEFSEMLEELTDEEMAWIEETCTFEHVEQDEDEQPAKLPDWYNPDALGVDFTNHLNIQEKTFWMYSEGEGGNLDTLGAFVHEFILKFRPDAVFTLTWAETCSKPRVGEFGGGALVISREGVKAMNTHHWAKTQRDEILKARGA